MPRRVMVLGADGYIGWPLVRRLLADGYTVACVDSLDKRRWCARWNEEPVFALPGYPSRVARLDEEYPEQVHAYTLDISQDAGHLFDLLRAFRPDTIVHLAEQPSAPLSMLNREACLLTLHNNLHGTMNLVLAVGRAVMEGVMPMPHIVKLGSMGEYGTPNAPIYEGILRCCPTSSQAGWLMPKMPGSWYHLSKVHDSEALAFACRLWGFMTTDINQGPVWGIDTAECSAEDKLQRTAFYAGPLFGTVINRFLFQAATDQPLSVYGAGGQTRGFIALADSVGAIRTVVENPPEAGQFRVINQLAEVWSVVGLAELVSKATGVEIASVPNPRVEDEAHAYQPEVETLQRMGWQPTVVLHSDEIRRIVALLRTDRRSLRRVVAKQELTANALWRKDTKEWPIGEPCMEGDGI